MISFMPLPPDLDPDVFLVLEGMPVRVSERVGSVICRALDLTEGISQQNAMSSRKQQAVRDTLIILKTSRCSG
jgi:hypothetical protein